MLQVILELGFLSLLLRLNPSSVWYSLEPSEAVRTTRGEWVRRGLLVVVKCTLTWRQHQRSWKSRVDTRRGAVKANLKKKWICVKTTDTEVKMGISEKRSSWSFEDSQKIKTTPKNIFLSKAAIESRSHRLDGCQREANVNGLSVSSSLTCSQQPQSPGPVWSCLHCSPHMANLCR